MIETDSTTHFPTIIDDRTTAVDAELDGLVKQRAAINDQIKSLRFERRALGRARRAFEAPKTRRADNTNEGSQ